jgi:hypothetical protein
VGDPDGTKTEFLAAIVAYAKEVTDPSLGMLRR